ncbi:hypothetical protein GCM10009613_47940 [Pseudonocardia kongjuensis]|uniref:STAS/SEC14 domain-containing protein n=1 Tax=Pseudonocardia kongjuensis TaxID=102227 RepID=A0ABN1Y2Y2_9PSEU
MIETLDGLPDGVDGFRPVGRISVADYEQVVVPVLDRADAERRRLRLLCVVDPAFTGLEPDALWEDLRVGLRAMPMMDGCAVVSDIGWIRDAVRIAAFLIPYPVRLFGAAEQAAAADWLRELPGGSGFSVQLLDDGAVAVVRVRRPLRVADIAALTATVDDWLRTHDELGGLVLSAPSLPGWQNLSSLLRHVRFVAGHHRRVRRVALAVDGTIGAWAPTVADLALHPEVRHFRHADEALAIGWAAAGVPAGSAAGPAEP